MSRRRRIAVVTGSRADYGLLRSLLDAIRGDERLTLQLLVTGTHLSTAFGMTIGEIEADGFTPDARIELPIGDTAVETASALGAAVTAFAVEFARLEPDVAVVLGDRFEILAAAGAALILQVPLAHIHGGEVSEGAYDESIRHAVTKLAQWHFVAAPEYRARVIQMGERPERVIETGAPGLDALHGTAWVDRPTLAAQLGLGLDSPLFLVTYHPVTLASESPTRPLDELLGALDTFVDASIVFTYPNADTGGLSLVPQIERFVAARPDRRLAVPSIARPRYLSLMRLADVVIGNSSSGLIEAPALKRPTVNIGDRQKGRLSAASVIDAPERRDDIVAAIRMALSDEFQRGLTMVDGLYGEGDAGRSIKDTLARIPLDVRKPFFDIPHGL